MVKIFISFLAFMQLFAAQGVLIPFYHYPSLHDRYVEELIDLKKRYPHVRMIVIINPNNGYVEKEESNFATAIERLSGSGIETIGYLHTSYANRSLKDVRANLSRWVKYYKKHGISGIFLDEVNCSRSDYYSKIAHAVKEHFDLVVANPGSYCKDANWSDIVVVHENSFYAKKREPRFRKEAALVYGVKDLDLEILEQYDYVYVTEYNGANPWSRLSSYLPALLKAIESRFQKGLNKNAVKLQVQSHE